MSRLMLAMVGCLVVGAGGMWVASNFKVKFEAVGTPNQPPPSFAQTPPPLAEPAKLPAHLLAQPAPLPQPTPGLLPASGAVPAVAVGGELAAIEVARRSVEQNAVEIKQILDGPTDNLLWPTDSPQPILVRGSRLTLSFQFADQAAFTRTASKLRFVAKPDNSNNETVFEVDPATDTTKVIDFAPTAFAGAKTVLLRAERDNPLETDATRKVVTVPITFTGRPTPQPSFTVSLPTAAGAAPLISKVFNGRFADGQGKKGSTPLAVYDQYLRVQVQTTAKNAEYDFLYADATASGRAVLVTANRVEPKTVTPDTLEFLVAWPNALRPLSGALLLVREKVGGSHSYDSVPVTVSSMPDVPAIPVAAKPVVPNKSPDFPLRKDGDAWLLGTTTVNVNVSIPTTTVTAYPQAFKDAAKVLLFVDKDPKNPLSAPTAGPLGIGDLKADASNSVATFENVSLSGDGDHVVWVVFEAGGVTSRNPTPIRVRVQRAGPTVRVSPTDLSNSNDNKLSLRFPASNPLVADLAGNKDNYRLIKTDGGGNGTVAAARYEAGTNGVVLQLQGPVAPGQYTLEMDGTDEKTDGTGRKGIRDVFGNPLGGSFETGGKVVTEGIVQPVGGAQPSATVGVTPGLPPHVPLAEYLPPRPSTNGVNPSDRVESRVVRLYYHRDAHQVVQTVNRNAKSYNGASVDIRRRAADLARADADRAQGDRQGHERAAVEAAEKARQAETELRQLEGQLQTARTQDAAAATQLTQRQQQLDDARRDLARGAAAADTRTTADGRVQAQRDILNGITADLGRANTGLIAAPGDASLRSQRDALQTRQEQELRRLEQLVREVQDVDRQVDPLRQTVRALEAEIDTLRQVRTTSGAAAADLTNRVGTLRASVQGLRTTEQQAREKSLVGDRDEQLKRQDQFRREVAAATANPATVVVPDPNSVDPVAQCELTVIGEGLIQIRGPVKGLNVIRTMVNQIDAPTGQVRIGVHTVQVNGERVEKVNRVVENIQRYIDHSRFLTATSAQMLRSAVTAVASRKAVEAGQTLAPGCTQADRDAKYLDCFFGKDFIDELRSLDSEFLRTGNKVLSLHSMDSTSLASALFLMSLARNDVREEILREFQTQLCTKLPQAEWEKFVSGLSCPSRLEACFDRQFCTLAKNAKFPSFLGFFGTEVLGADTLTPVQREFIRLAQIFKARMVTELELKQRVMERTLLENRIGDVQEEQRKAKEQEDAAKEDRFRYQAALQTVIAQATLSLGQLEGQVTGVESQLSRFETLLGLLESPPAVGKPLQVGGQLRDIPPLDDTKRWIVYRDPKYDWVKSSFRDAASFLSRFTYASDEYRTAAERTKKLLDKLADDSTAELAVLGTLKTDVAKLFRHISQEIEAARAAIGGIVRELRKERPNVELVLNRFEAFRRDLAAKLSGSDSARELNAQLTGKASEAFDALQRAFVAAQSSSRVAALSRRALDEKKLLDMMVDDMEEKLVELLDGTRAHTANVDNYLKSLSTALEDDFATQFYQPAFKQIRTLGARAEVYLGQIESTTVLTNNRVLGKVSPTASMEFDLPRRDILIREAFKGAKAAVQDYGALLNDPVFLSMVKMYSGSPVGATYGGFGGLPAVRNMLPGLPGSADELIMAQSGGKRPEFGTYLEGLIADPSVYKFETGTGYEIRPVLSPDGQAVVFGFDYMYTTDVREPVRADEKHLGRVKRHLLHTDVQLSNFELREVSKYWVSLKAARTGRGVALLQDIPVAGALFRPAPSASSSLQQNLIYSQAAIFPTLFDLMGLRYAPAVADLTPDGLIDDEFVTRARQEYLRQHIFDYGASRVDDALRILYGERRPDLYRSQRSIPAKHPNGYQGPGLRQRDADLIEEYDPGTSYPQTKYAPGLRVPQNLDRDPFGPMTPPPGGPVIPPGVIIPGHSPGGYPSSREMPRTPLGTTVTRVPPTPRLPTALPPIPMNAAPTLPPSVPVIAPPPATPTPPTGVISRSQAPLDPPAGPRVYPSDPVPLPRGSFFPR